MALLVSRRSGRVNTRSSSNKLIATSQTSRPALMAPRSSRLQRSSVKKVFALPGLHRGSRKREDATPPGKSHQERDAPPIALEAPSPFAPSFQEDWFLPVDRTGVDAIARPDTSGAIWTYDDHRKNPFEDEVVTFQTSVEHPSMFAPEGQKEHAYIMPFDKPQPPTSVDEVVMFQTSVEYPLMPASEEQKKHAYTSPFSKPQPPTGVQQYYTMNTITNPFMETEAVDGTSSLMHESLGVDELSSALEEDPAPSEDGDFAAALQNFGFLPHQDSMEMAIHEEVEEQSASVERLPAAEPAMNPFDVQEQRVSGENFVLGDPFVVKEQPLSVFATEPYLENITGEPASAQPPSEHGFLFGNPFDGPLPDVFQHDEELKQSIAEQSKGRSTAPFPGPDEEPSASGTTPVKPKRTRGKRGKGSARANQNAPDQANQKE
jgi:hypothetical protein